jgi:uncharacterized membrane protein YccC
MASTPAVGTRPAPRPWRAWRLPPNGGVKPAWLPVWSTASALRALRAVLVVPGMFALSYKVIGDLQVATFAAFGGFATLVMATFGGRLKDKLLAHLGLAVAGSVLLVIGTAVNFNVVLASLVTLPVVFCVLFAGVGGPNAASAATAALLAYVLPAASPGAMSMVPERLAGWWLASVAGTLAVLLLSPRAPGVLLREALARTARALSDQLAAALRGEIEPKRREQTLAAKHDLFATFTATPYRPTGLSSAEQAVDSLVGLLEWCTTVVCDSLSEYADLSGIDPVERQLLAETSATLADIATLLSGGATLPDLTRPDLTKPDLTKLERSLADSVEHLRTRLAEHADLVAVVHLSFHARTVAVAAHTAMADALIAAHRADPELVSGRRRHWYGVPAEESVSLSERRLPGLSSMASVVFRHANLRSVWFRNSARGAVALAAAIAVADLTGVQHGFWVVLGTLSVLRTSAAATGATALRALLGTVAGFVIGALLLLVIGTTGAALWTALPVAVIIAAYAPGALPFAAGQAAFTVVVSVLFNLLAPAGWQIGVLRVEDVAIGCLVSLVVGVLFWPRGAGSLVADDLADAFRASGAYLADSTNWALGLRTSQPAASTAIAAGLRLDDALRGFLAEQGTKRVPREQLWRLVSGTLRARLTGHSLAGMPSPMGEPDDLHRVLGEQAGQLAAWYDHLASRLDRTDHGSVPMLNPPQFTAPPEAHDMCLAWVGEHLRHITPRLDELVEPASAVAAQRHGPWWR